MQRSLTILEDRYRELREAGEQRFESFESEVATLKAELKVVREEKEGLAGELKVVREEKEGLAGELKVVREEKEGLARQFADARDDGALLLLQLHQVQEELEHYFFESRRQAEKIHWLRGQRELLVRMLRAQARKLRAFMAMDGRIALPALKRQSLPWWHQFTFR